MSEGATEGVQGGEPQGGEGSGSFVDDYLAQVPDDYRAHVEPYIRQVESNTNKRFQEHADYRKQWEPYESLDLSQYDPEGLGELLQFAQTMEDPAEFKNWWTQVGQQSGFISELIGNNGDEEFETGETGFEGLDADGLRDILSELLDEKVKPLQEREAEREQQAQIEAANNQIEQQLAALKQEHGEFDEQAVIRFAYGHADTSDNPIAAGFKDYQNMVAQIETNTVNGRINQPAPPEQGGGPANTGIEAPGSFSEASKMARERFAQGV